MSRTMILVEERFAPWRKGSAYCDAHAAPAEEFASAQSLIEALTDDAIPQ